MDRSIYPPGFERYSGQKLRVDSLKTISDEWKAFVNIVMQKLFPNSSIINEQPTKQNMDVVKFQQTLTKEQPDPTWPDALRALWWAGKGDWQRSHSIAQDDNSRNGSWIHAYLHREEGDLGNAGYWYRLAGKQVFQGDTLAEWQQIAEAILSENLA